MKTAEEILKENTGHAHGLMDAMAIKSMKEYASQIADQALLDAANKLVQASGTFDSDFQSQRRSILCTTYKLP